MKRILTIVFIACAIIVVPAGKALAAEGGGTTVAFTGAGAGGVVPGPDCTQHGSSTCTLQSNGFINTTPGGQGTYAATITEGNPNTNTSAVTAAQATQTPASGPIVITYVDGSTLSAFLNGTVTGGPPGTPQTFTGTYTITGGTGRLAGASGTGLATGQGFGVAVVFHVNGNITTPGPVPPPPCQSKHKHHGDDDSGGCNKDDGHDD